MQYPVAEVGPNDSTTETSVNGDLLRNTEKKVSDFMELCQDKFKDNEVPNQEFQKEAFEANSKMSSLLSQMAPEEFSESEPLVPRNILFPIKQYHTPMTKMASLMSPKIIEQEENQ